MGQGWHEAEKEAVGSDRLEEELHTLITGALAGDSSRLTLDLSGDRFPQHGVALDTASRMLEARGWRLTKVVAEGNSWHATYERMALPD